jgi:hypothetical protein
VGRLRHDADAAGRVGGQRVARPWTHAYRVTRTSACAVSS